MSSYKEEEEVKKVLENGKTHFESFEELKESLDRELDRGNVRLNKEDKGYSVEKVGRYEGIKLRLRGDYGKILEDVEERLDSSGVVLEKETENSGNDLYKLAVEPKKLG